MTPMLPITCIEDCAKAVMVSHASYWSLKTTETRVDIYENTSIADKQINVFPFPSNAHQQVVE